MPNKFFTGKCGIAVLAFGIAVSAGPAHAGFQWVAPPDAPQSSGGGTVQGYATRSPEVVSPVVITGDNGPTIESTAASPSVPLSMPSDSNLATATIPASNDVVQGFASEVPLALALRQILPVGVKFSIDQNIDMDTVVSYKGGKPWRETVKEMLAPAGLTAREQGSTVLVSRIGATPAKAGPVVDSGPGGPVVISAPGGSKHIMQSSGPVSGGMSGGVNVSSPNGWSAERGDTLRKVLSEWCRRSGVELQWLAEYDYPMEASAHFNGGFEDAVRSLLAGFESAHPQPVAELHANSNAGQMLLVVQARGNNYSN